MILLESWLLCLSLGTRASCIYTYWKSNVLSLQHSLEAAPPEGGSMNAHGGATSLLAGSGCCDGLLNVSELTCSLMVPREVLSIEELIRNKLREIRWERFPPIILRHIGRQRMTDDVARICVA